MRLPSTRQLRAYASWALCSLVVGYVFVQLNKRFFYNGIGYDESFFVWGGWSINRGLVPYRDFIEFKPPFLFLTHALAIKLFGFAGQRYRIFFLLFPLCSCVALLLAMLQRGLSRLLASAVALAVVMMFTVPKLHDTALSDSEAIGTTYFLLGISCLLLRLPAASVWRKASLVLGGIFLTACALSKEPYAPCVAFTWLAGFLLNGTKNLRGDAPTYARYSLLGVAAVVVGLCLYMVPSGAMSAYLKMAQGYSRMYRDPKLSYCILLGVAKPETPWNAFLTGWQRAREQWLNLADLGYVAPLFVVGAALTLRRSLPLFVACALALGGAIYGATASNCPWPHYMGISIPGIVLCLVVGAESISITTASPRFRGTAAARRIVGALALGWIVVTLAPRLEFETKATYSYPPLFEPFPGLVAFITQNTTPTDTIFTSGPPLLYVQANRLSALRESNIIDEVLGSYPDGSDEEKLRPLYDQLVRNRPKIVVLDPEHADRKRRHYAAFVLPFLQRFDYKETRPGVYVRP